MNQLLPNMRWMCLPSDLQGEDWKDKSILIDHEMVTLGLELSEESVYILYTHTPEDVLEGLGGCWVARPVIGPKKNPAGEFKLLDWKSTPVFQSILNGQTLGELLLESRSVRRIALKTVPGLKEAFTLRVHRRLIPELLVQTEVIFNE